MLNLLQRLVELACRHKYQDQGEDRAMLDVAVHLQA